MAAGPAGSIRPGRVRPWMRRSGDGGRGYQAMIKPGRIELERINAVRPARPQKHAPSPPFLSFQAGRRGGCFGHGNKKPGRVRDPGRGELIRGQIRRGIRPCRPIPSPRVMRRLVSPRDWNKMESPPFIPEVDQSAVVQFLDPARPEPPADRERRLLVRLEPVPDQPIA